MAAITQMESSDEDTLRRLAAGESIDYSTWPLLLTTVVSRIDKIAHHDFPVPRLPQPAATAASSSIPEPRFLAPLPSSPDPAVPSSSVNNEIEHSATVANSVDSSQETNKENAAPGPPQSDAQTSSPEQRPPTLSEPTASHPNPDVLPPQIIAMLAEITGILNETFHTYPPHTIQRLAELVLEPRRYYRSLPSYLHAVDRVVHVTSGNNIYPLPPAIPDMSHMSINGVTDAHNEDGSVDGRPSSAAVWASSSIGAPIGSDEALGGALLSPIPWLLRGTSNGDEAGSDAGSEPSTLSSSEAGPAPVGGAMASSHQQQNPSAAQHRPGQGQQHFERQVRTESTETIEGPNGMGSIETVTVSINGISSMSAAQQQRVITQGELIRQEQRAGAAPAGQSARAGPVVASVSQANDPSSSPTSEEAENDTTMAEDEDEDHQDKNEEAPSAQATTATGTASTTANDNTSEKSDEEMTDEDGAPHARGPDLIGAEDMGPQTPSSSTFSISSGGNSEMHSIDVEAAVGRKNEAQIPAAAAAGAAITSGAEQKGDNTPSESSSEDAVVLTPVSTDGEASREPTQQAAASVGSSSDRTTNSGASEVQEDKSDATSIPQDQPPQQQPAAESMDTEPDPSSPAKSIVSTTPSLGKREAENDPDDELDSKRLKESPSEDKEQQKAVDDVRLASGGETQSASKITASPTPQTEAGKEPDDQGQDVVSSTTTKDEADKQDATSSSAKPDATSTANIPTTEADADADTEDADPNLQIEQEVKAAAVAAEAEAAKEEKEKEKNVTESAPAASA